MTVIDGHAHVDEIDNLDAALARAAEAGVSAVVGVSSDYASSQRTLEIAGRYGDLVVYPALGIHPWNLKISELTPMITFIEGNLHHCVALGEIGLDFWLKEARKDPSARKLQEEVFMELLALCRKHDKPAIIHARGAWPKALDIVCRAAVPKAVFHWYSGPPGVLQKILEQGYYISATPAAEYSEKHQQAITLTPLERLLVETDAPVSYQGTASEPADVLRTVTAVAKLKAITPEEVAAVTSRTAQALFGLP